MPRDHPLSQSELVETLTVVSKSPTQKQAADKLGISVRQLRRRLRAAASFDIEVKSDSPFAVEHPPQIGTHGERVFEIKSDKNNIYRFGAFGDLHAASKYCRWDIRENLTKRAEDFGAVAILDAGNWCEGQAPFNRYDLQAVGMDDQLELLASRYPRSKLPTYAVTAKDHEGWWISREGIDVGRYCEHIMRSAGHNWNCLGYIEADIILKNYNTGATALCRVVHPAGGTAYALSYKPQKYIESLEGGEKPNVLLIGHFHKLESGNVRNVWYTQVGTQQDQTPYLRTRPAEAHVGGVLLELEQDPLTGSIVRFRPDMLRYYATSRSGNRRWVASGPVKPVPRELNAS